MNTEQVFPKYERTISIGASPDVSPRARNIRHSGTDFKVKIPPIGIYADYCWLDLGRPGSAGYVLGASYSRFGYNWLWDDGYGDKVMETSCNRFDVQAGLSWHFTICRNFETYARAMVDIGVIGNNTVNAATGDKNISDSDFNTDVSAAAAVGLRWYFSRAAGLWMEGGNNTGYVSAGLSFRF